MDSNTKEFLEEVFSLIDKSGGHTIEAKDISLFLRAGGTNPTEAEIGKVVDELGGPDTKITFEQALTQFQSMLSKSVKPDKEKFIDVFKIYDRDGNGLIAAAELRQILGTLGDKLKDDEISKVISGFQDVQGLVRYEDLIEDVLKG